MSENSQNGVINQWIFLLPLAIAVFFTLAGVAVMATSGGTSYDFGVAVGRGVGSFICMVIASYIIALPVWHLSKKNRKASTVAFAVVSCLIGILNCLIFIGNFLDSTPGGKGMSQAEIDRVAGEVTVNMQARAQELLDAVDGIESAGFKELSNSMTVADIQKNREIVQDIAGKFNTYLQTIEGLPDKFRERTDIANHPAKEARDYVESEIAGFQQSMAQEISDARAGIETWSALDEFWAILEKHHGS